MLEKWKENVLAEVRKQMQSTVISYPERDPKGHIWGDKSWRGNCSGKVPLGFIDKLGAKSVAELFAGSGTLSDVCKDFGIPYTGIDLNPNPVRGNIITMDVLDFNTELPDAFSQADMIFSHPPYPGINHIKYAGGMYKADDMLKNRDIQHADFEKGMKMINTSTMRAYSAMKPGAYMVILVGEIRNKILGYKSMFQHLTLPGEIYQTYIKMQHNTWSDKQGYSQSKNARAMTAHEMIAVIKKPGGYDIVFLCPAYHKADIRDSKQTATWKDVLNAVMHKLGGAANLSAIYAEIEGHEKCKTNPNWKAKVRQTLQMGNYVTNGIGYWRIAAA